MSRFESQITPGGRGFSYAVSGFGQVLIIKAYRPVAYQAFWYSRESYTRMLQMNPHKVKLFLTKVVRLLFFDYDISRKSIFNN